MDWKAVIDAMESSESRNMSLTPALLAHYLKAGLRKDPIGDYERAMERANRLSKFDKVALEYDLQELEAIESTRKKFSDVTNFATSDQWGCTSEENPHKRFCCFDADKDAALDDCLYCGLPVERK